MISFKGPITSNLSELCFFEFKHLIARIRVTVLLVACIGVYIKFIANIFFIKWPRIIVIHQLTKISLILLMTTSQTK